MPNSATSTNDKSSAASILPSQESPPMGIPGRISCRCGSRQPGSTGRRSLFGRHLKGPPRRSHCVRPIHNSRRKPFSFFLTILIVQRSTVDGNNRNYPICGIICGCLVANVSLMMMRGLSVWSFVNDFISHGLRQRVAMISLCKCSVVQFYLCMFVCDGGFNNAGPSRNRASEIWCGTRRVGAKVSNHCPIDNPVLPQGLCKKEENVLCPRA